MRPNLVNCSAWLSAFQNAINAGRRLILPARCDLSENSWTGAGYFDIGVSGGRTTIGAIIGGGLAGGFSTTSQPAANYTNNTLANTFSWRSLTQTLGSFFHDPIDRFQGHFIHAHEDLKVGVGDFPYALSFQRLYSSGLRTRAGPLGWGWTHNLAATARVRSDGFQGLGEDSALDAVATLVEKQVALDLLSDPAKPIDKLVIATLGQRWLGDQLIGNTVIVRRGLNGEVFVKLPDGTYNPPPGNSARLIRNADGTFTYETLHRDRLHFNAAGQIAAFQAASGVQVRFTYSGSELMQVQNSLGRSLTLTYSAGRLAQVSDGVRTVHYGYDGSGNLATFTDAVAQVTAFRYDRPGRLTQLFYPANPSVAFVTNVYDSLGRVQTQTDANGKVYTYYFAGARSEENGPLGLRRVAYFDAWGRELKSIDPLNRVTTHTYDGQGRLIKTVWSEGNSVTYAYDNAPCAGPDRRCTHNVKTIRHVAKPGSGLADVVTTFTYEGAFNRLASLTDPRGNVTDYTYTLQGLLATVTRPADSSGVRPVTTYAYTPFTPAGFPSFYLLSSITEKINASESVVTALAYQAGNRYVPQAVTVDAGAGRLNLTTTYSYDAVGNLVQVDGPRTDVADTVTYQYDGERRWIQRTDALGKLTFRAYDGNGNLVRTAAQIGGQWLVSCWSYTPSNQLLKAWGPGQVASATHCPAASAPVAVTDYAYDDLDRRVRVTENLTPAQGGNRVREIVYNLDDSVQQVKRAVGTGLAQVYASYTYTPNGQIRTVQDAVGNRTTYSYDGHDRLVKTQFPDKSTAGVSSSTDYEQYGYDAAGNLTSLRKRSGQTIVLGYDNLHRLISKSYPTPADNVSYGYDLLGRRTQVNMAGYGVSYGYDRAGRLISATLGGRTVSYQYDAAGNRTRITWPDGFYVTFSYDALNRPREIRELGSAGLASYGYDDLSRRTGVTWGNGTTTSYSYTPQSSLASLSHNLAGTAQDVTFTYPRNQAQQITQVQVNNAAYLWTGAVNGTTSYTRNGLNQYTQVAGVPVNYDGNGNLLADGVWSYSYDLDNRLKTAAKADVSASLAYDGEGRLRQVTVGSATHQFLHDGLALIAEYDGAGALVRRYVPGPGVDEPIVQYAGGVKTWLLGDQLGSIVASADGSGAATAIYTYGPFGESNLPIGVRFGYTGQVSLGLLGLYSYKARMYSPALGRFLQPDPIGYADDLNLYAYVGNDPVNAKDPNGLLTEVLVFEGAGSGSSSQGHVAVKINGTIYSYGPEGMARKTIEEYMSRNSFRWAIGRILDIDSSQEKLIETNLQNFDLRHPYYNPLTCNCTDPIEESLESLGYDLGYNITPNALAYSLDRSGLVKSFRLYPATAPAIGYTAPYASDLPLPAISRLSLPKK